MHFELIKSMERNFMVDMMYMAKDCNISKRRFKVLWDDEGAFRAYCYLWNSNRTFKFDKTLALVPISIRERIVV